MAHVDEYTKAEVFRAATKLRRFLRFVDTIPCLIIKYMCSGRTEGGDVSNLLFTATHYGLPTSQFHGQHIKEARSLLLGFCL